MRDAFKILTLLMLSAMLTACHRQSDASSVVDDSDTLPSLVTQVQKCARLYTTEYHIRKIVTHDDVVRLKGNVLQQDFDIPLPLGERKIAIPMDAILKAYIDFSNFSERNIERDGDRITILLPDPKVVMTASTIDQDQIREYVGLIRPHFTDKELTVYEQQGRQAILNSVPELGIVEASRQDATRVLVPLLTAMGYQEANITIAFRKSLDIRQLINSNLERK